MRLSREKINSIQTQEPIKNIIVKIILLRSKKLESPLQ
jgi:hypothetical protein